MSAEVVVEARNQLGEGVLWSPADNEVQWTDIFGRRFWTYHPSDGASRSVALPDRLACFAPLGGTRFLAGFAGGLEVFDLEGGARQPIAAVEADRPTTRLNDGKRDRRGRLAREPQAGALFAVDAGVRGLADTAFPPARLPPRD